MDRDRPAVAAGPEDRVTAVLVAPVHGQVEVRSPDLATGPAEDPANPAHRVAGHAVLVLGDDGGAWLRAPHADGRVDAAVIASPTDLARRWAAGMRAGFVAADAALLALWDGHGPLPTLTWGDRASPHLAPAPAPAGLYAIVDDLPRLRGVLRAGLRWVQLRIKAPADAGPAWFDAVRRPLRDAIAMARDAGATLVVNDHWRLAAELGADTVHLGQEDLQQLGTAGRAELAASGLALGVSSHAVWELCRARSLRPALVACGPVWPTLTKAMPWRPQGLDNLGWWCARAGLPVVAIGGVLEPAQVRAAARAGAAAVCLVRGLGDEPWRTVPAFHPALRAGRAFTAPTCAAARR